jgi:hypothetical protein
VRRERQKKKRGILMKHSVKGAFLSGAVFPGLGQVVLKHYVRGIALMLAVSASLVVLVKKALEQALAILEKIQWEGGTIDMTTISNAATRASTNSDSHTVNLLLFLIVSCWLVGTVDAYRIGRKKDLEEQSTTRGAA